MPLHTRPVRISAPPAAAALVSLILLASPAAADKEVEELKRQVEEQQQRIEQLERNQGRTPAKSPPAEAANAADTPDVAADPDDFEVTDQSGNDPRDFSSKFMPYYRYTKLDNDVEVNEMTVFGFFAFTGRFGMTYELPLAKKLDYNVKEFRTFKGMLPGGCPPTSLTDPGGELPPIGIDPGAAFQQFSELDCDGDEIGLGDLGLRFFVRPRQLEWNYGNNNNFSLIPVVEMTMPTATDDTLGGESFILSPGVVPVMDLPFDEGPLSFAFLALMNFYDFDAYKDDDRGRTERFRGRWFYMQPLSPPTDEMSFLDLSGLYVMTEFQPVYDFVQDHFSFWVGPEFGKIIYPGLVFYGKPGWGIDSDASKGDRSWTFEFGMRWFFK